MEMFLFYPFLLRLHETVAWKSIFPLLAEAGGIQNVCLAPCFAPLGVRNTFYSWVKWVARTLDILAS
jgi:hypothetical protein